MIRFCFLYNKTLSAIQEITKVYFTTHITLLSNHLLLLEKPLKEQVELELDFSNYAMKCFITFDKTEEEIEQLIIDNKLKYDPSNSKCYYEEDLVVKEFDSYGDVIKFEKSIQDYYKENYCKEPDFYYDYDKSLLVGKKSSSNYFYYVTSESLDLYRNGVAVLDLIPSDSVIKKITVINNGASNHTLKILVNNEVKNTILLTSEEKVKTIEDLFIQLSANDVLSMSYEGDLPTNEQLTVFIYPLVNV